MDSGPYSKRTPTYPENRQNKRNLSQIIEFCYFIFRISPKTPPELKVLTKFEMINNLWKTMEDGLAVQA